MVNENLALTARTAHDWGLASWLGGAMFGKFAHNPSVAQISDKSERGKVVNAAWNGYNLINSLSLAAVGLGWIGARTTETRPDKLTGRERRLASTKDAFVATAVVSGALSGIQGARLARKGSGGAVPIERGTEPAPETPQDAARIQRSLGVLGNLNILAGVGLVVVNALIAQLDHSRPPLRRTLFRRSA